MKITDVVSHLFEDVAEHNERLYAYAVVVAEAYEAAPVFDPKTKPAYEALAKHNELLFKRASRRVDISFTPDDPYNTPEAAARDVKQNNRLEIYSGGDDHPTWTRDQNNVFRAVHDFYTHIGKNLKNVNTGKFKSYSFKYRGELNTYLVHAKMAPKIAVPVLFTEVVGQISYFVTSGGYAPQKAAILEGFDYFKLGRMDARRQQRFDQIVEQLFDSSIEQIPIRVAGGMNIDKSSIRWGLISPGTGIKKRT